VGDESVFIAWLRAFITNPEKAALLLVIVVGAWRWIREMIRELRGAEREETLMEMLIRENRELREELRKDREDDHE
jgi:hypothetical protein